MGRIFFFIFIILVNVISLELVYISEEVILGICFFFLLIIGIIFLRKFVEKSQSKFFVLMYSYYYLSLNCFKIVRFEILELLFLVELLFEYVLTCKKFFSFVRSSLTRIELYMVVTIINKFIE